MFFVLSLICIAQYNKSTCRQQALLSRLNSVMLKGNLRAYSFSLCPSELLAHLFTVGFPSICLRHPCANTKCHILLFALALSTAKTVCQIVFQNTPNTLPYFFLY